jgi:hypothetical protein
MFNWINALRPQFRGFVTLFSRVSQADIGKTPEAHVARLAAECESINPRPSPRRSDLQIQAFTVAVHSGTGVLNRFHRKFAHHLFPPGRDLSMRLWTYPAHLDEIVRLYPSTIPWVARG